MSWWLTPACDDSSKHVPPASQWKPPEVVPSEVGGAEAGARDPHSGAKRRASRSPHDGDGPHRTPGEDEDADDPHAGLDIDDPHAGLDMEEDDLGGLEPPDPDRPIDATRFLRGTIRAAAKAGPFAPGATIFLSAWPFDKATGEVLGSPLAVAKMTLDKLPVDFRLDERNMMVKGTQFAGDVLVVARVDQDGEARTKQPGDVEGHVRARIPAEKIDLVLDTPLK